MTDTHPWSDLHADPDYADIVRMQRRFRYHVRTRYNPRGRIVRPKRCAFHSKRCWFQDPDRIPEAHHPFHDEPFVVVFVCLRHHRAVERDPSMIRPEHIRDFTAIVRTAPERWAPSGCPV